MSDRETDESPRGDEQPPIVAWVRERVEVVTLLGVAVFMLWVRMRSYENFVRDGEVFLAGNDPYYHLRQVSYTVRNWPAVMPYDPWTYYPFGTNSNQFGTLFDQVVATAALIVGLGDPSQQLVAKTLLVAPAVIGAVLAFPTYYAGKRVGGTWGGLFGVVVLALLPATNSGILSRTLVGSADHQAAEALAQMTAVLAMLIALGVARDEKPVYELVLDRDYDALRRPVGWSAVAGVAIGLYIWTWPPAVLMLAFSGVFFAVKMGSDYYNGRSPEPMAFVAVVSMSVAAVLSMLPTTMAGFSPTNWSLLQPATALGVAGGAAFLAWLAREFDERELDPALYPTAIGAMALVGVGTMIVVLPSIWSTISRNVQRILLFSAGAGTRTISEAQPFLARAGRVISAREMIMLDYGLTFFLAVLALVVLLGGPLFYSTEPADHATLIGGLLVVGAIWELDVGTMVLDAVALGVAPVVVETALLAVVILVAMVRSQQDAEELYVAVWMLFMTAAAFTQVRFNYYLALSVVVLNAYLIGGKFLPYIKVVDEAGNFAKEIEPYQMMALMLALMTILPALVVPIPYYEQQISRQETRTYYSSTAWEAANGSNPGFVTTWDPTLDWMSNNTPEEGQYGGADNRMAYYGTYKATDDYAYEDGTYGVMSWWDYGHWITVEGERIPNANPFQQGAKHAANFLLAPSEEQANQVLQRDVEGPEETRYVVIDWQMVDPYGKFSAPTVFYTDSNASYVGDFTSGWHYQVSQSGRVTRAYRLMKQRYYESMMVRLYRFNGDRVEPKPYVIRWREVNGSRVIPRNDRPVVRKRSMRAARQAVQKYRNQTPGPNERGTPNATIGGIGPWVREPVPALQHYRLVRASKSTEVSRRGERPSYLRPVSRVKVFERVPGAKVVGQGPPNMTILASVQLRYGTRNKTFTYTQQARTGPDGRFTLTLPYSTTGYDKWGTKEGYTNVSVRATGPYRISTESFTALNFSNNTAISYSTSLNVTEAQVIGENTSTIRVTLEKNKIPLQPPNQNKTDGNATSGNATGNSTNSSALRAPSGLDAATVGSARQPVTDGGVPPMSSAGARDPGSAAGGLGGLGAASEGSSALGGLLLFALLAGVVLAEVRDERLP